MELTTTPNHLETIRAKDILIRKGIRPSVQRMRIYDLLHELPHATANEIHARLVGEIPTLSRATVYNTMELFQAAGIADILPGRELRFHPHPLSPHAHFICSCCDKVYDLDDELPVKDFVEGHAVESLLVTYVGLCKTCRKEK